MDKKKTLKNFLQEVSVPWFVEHFSSRLTELKKSLLEIPSFEEQLEHIWKSSIDINTLNKFIDEVKKNLGSITNFEDIDTFTQKYDLNNPNLQGKIFPGEISTENLDAKNRTGITKMILTTHISSALKILCSSFKVCKKIESKLGENTLISEIDQGDLEYILMNFLEKSISSINRWCLKFSFIGDKCAAELKALNESKTVMDVSETSHTIERVFVDIVGNYLSSQKNNDDDSEYDHQEEYKTIIEINHGVELSEILFVKASYCETILIKFLSNLK